MLKTVLSSFMRYDYVIFTSENGVKIFFEELFTLSCDARIFSGKKICAIGRKTKETLLRYGLNADIVPERGTSEGLWEKLSGEIKKENNVFLVQAKNGRKYLSEELQKSCNLTCFFPYETKAEETDAERLRDLIKNARIDAIIFTSPSTVTNFLSYIPVRELNENNVKLFSIGEITTRAIEKSGLSVCAESEKTDIRSLVLTVKNVFCGKEEKK